MKTNRNWWMAFSVALLMTIPSVARSQNQIPAAINYQGRLTDTLGNPLSGGYYEIEFRIWDDAVANQPGDFVWGRSFPLHVVTNGLFTILLTDDGGQITTPTTPTNTLLDAFGGPDRYLGLTITVSNGVNVSESEISPRQQLASAPFAIQAQQANTVGPLGVSSTSLANGSVSADKLAPGAVTTDNLVAGAVTTSKIADGAVTIAQLSGNLTASLALLGGNQTFTGQNKFVSSADPVLYVNDNGGTNQLAKFEMTGANVIIRPATTTNGKVAVIENTGAYGGLALNPDHGPVGIGTTTPMNALLDVEGAQTSAINGNYSYLNGSGIGQVSRVNQAPYSVWASDRMAAIEFDAFSDARIKHITGRSDGRKDLKTLLGLQITDYTMRDKVKYGEKPFKKVIAQQVGQVYPQAVTTNLTEVVPDIYVRARAKAGWISLEKKVEPELKPGDEVRLILENRAQLYEVKEASDGGFRVDSSVNGPVFVYGRQVHDFHTVDYEALTTLNISATQELYDRLVQSEQAVAKLRMQNQDLQPRVAGLEARDLEQQAQFTALEKLVHESLSGVQQASLH